MEKYEKFALVITKASHFFIIFNFQTHISFMVAKIERFEGLFMEYEVICQKYRLSRELEEICFLLFGTFGFAH